MIFFFLEKTWEREKMDKTQEKKHELRQNFSEMKGFLIQFCFFFFSVTIFSFHQNPFTEQSFCLEKIERFVDEIENFGLFCVLGNDRH